MSKALSYHGLSESYRVLFDTTDVSDDLIQVDGINLELDIDTVGEFTVDNAKITLDNTSKRYSGSLSNIFLDLGYAASGYGTPVIIYCGFQLPNGSITDDIVFQGDIIKVREGVKEFSVVVEVGDISRDLYDTDLTNFGFQKYGKIEQDTEKTQEGIRGVYPLGPVLSPVSEGSISGTSGMDALIYKEEFDREGMLNPLNFNYNDDELRTEGGPLSVDPIITGKAPYRHKRVEDLVRRILDHYNITNRQIEVPFIPLTADTFSTNGRVGYYTEGSDSGNTDVIRWNRMVTDYIYDSTNSKFYFLYSHRYSDVLPQILEYTVATDSWDVLFELTTHAEFWRMTTMDNNDLFILGTTGASDNDWSDRYYDSSHVGSDVRIWKYDIAADDFDVFLDNTETNRPQLASFLQLGFNDDLDAGAAPRVPDTNKGFQIVNGNLYYRYANATRAGVAKIPVDGSGTAAALYEFEFDRRHNQTSFDFYIDGANSVGYGYVNYVHQTKSKFQIFTFII